MSLFSFQGTFKVYFWVTDDSLSYLHLVGRFQLMKQFYYLYKCYDADTSACDQHSLLISCVILMAELAITHSKNPLLA
jgi:hypothetical protein